MGFEPTTSGLEVRRANPLRYGDDASFIGGFPYVWQHRYNGDQLVNVADVSAVGDGRLFSHLYLGSLNSAIMYDE